MNKYQIRIVAQAYATVTVEAPTAETALEYLNENYDGYGLDYEIDTMDTTVDAGWRDVQRNGVTVVGEVWGVEEVDNDTEANYCVDTEWLEENDYEVVTTIRKRETV
jgi:hypothetical protein